jgi:hypothetical protein
MASGDFILASDYNAIRNKIIRVLGTGDGSHGYGQSIQSSPVSVGNTVTKTQWDLLRFDIYNALFHQTGSVPSISSATVGSVITFSAASPNNQYDTLSDTATTNRFNLGTGQFVTNTNVSTATRTDAWNVRLECTLTATFGTAAQARYFFNSGSQIRVATTRTGGASTAQNTSWSNILSGAGTRLFGAQLPTSGFSPLDGTNYFRLTNTFQTFYTTTGSSPYASNRYSLQASSNVADNTGGTARIVYIKVVLDDPYVDPPVGTPPLGGFDIGPEDVVDGTLTTVFSEVKASGTLQPSPSAGNFDLASPTYSVTSFTGS